MWGRFRGCGENKRECLRRDCQRVLLEQLFFGNWTKTLALGGVIPGEILNKNKLILRC